MRKILIALVTAVALTGIGTPHVVHASNANSQDCNGNWVGGPNTSTSQIETTSGSPGYTTIATAIFYACYWSGNGYVVETDVEHLLSGGADQIYNPFAAYDCSSIWRHDTGWNSPALGCQAPTVRGGCQSFSYHIYCNYRSDSYFWTPTNALPVNAGFASNDRSGTGATIVQPYGGNQMFPYVENWNDQ